MKLKKGDTIKVLIGKDKDRSGKIERVFPKSDSVLIEGINQFKRHVKAREKNQKSEIVLITKPMRASKVALICPKCKKPTRVGFKIEKAMPAGRQEIKIRICRKCNKEID